METEVICFLHNVLVVIRCILAVICVSLSHYQDDASQYWLKRGCPKHKLLIGLAGHARTFVLGDDVVSPDFHSHAVRLGDPAPITKTTGMMSYYEVS